METPAKVSIEARQDGPTAALSGDWTSTEIGSAAGELAEAMAERRDMRLDLHAVGRCDTAGA
jgi:ABC-type transporter Mla MlaB component